jgi:hypothetical protein
MAGILSSSPFQNSKPHPQIRSETPGIARRSSGQFQLQRQLRRAITFDHCVVGGIQGHHCVRLIEIFVPVPLICRSDQRFVPNRQYCARLRRTSFSPVSLHHLLALCSSFCSPPRSPPSLSPSGGGHPPPLTPPPPPV